MKLNYKKLDPEAKEPTYGSTLAAGCDFYTISETVIEPGKYEFIKTGLAIELPKSYFLLLCPRSSLILKNNLDMPNSVGVIDEDYRGEIMIVLRNLGDKAVTIAKGERIAQGIIMKYNQIKFLEVKKLSPTNRGTGGFGSTGK